MLPGPAYTSKKYQITLPKLLHLYGIKIKKSKVKKITFENKSSYLYLRREKSRGQNEPTGIEKKHLHFFVPLCVWELLKETHSHQNQFDSPGMAIKINRKDSERRKFKKC